MNKISGLLLVLFACIFTVACNKKRGTPIKAYPNPATTFIIFDVSENGNKFKNGKITVKRMNGTIVETFPILDSSPIRWEIELLERGIYSYWYTADNMKTQSGKLQFN